MKSTLKVGTNSVKKKFLTFQKKAVTKVKTKKKAILFKVSTTKDRLHSKLEKIAELHQKEAHSKLLKAEIVPKAFFNSSISLRPKHALTILSPYRFPLPATTKKVAIRVARYG